MKKFLIFLIFISFLPAFASEIQDSKKTPNEQEESAMDESANSEENKSREENTFDKNEYHHLRNAANISPKGAHKVLLNKVQKKLEVDKTKFYKTKNKQLWLLREEADFLEYAP